jgi:hypothetical protein
VNLGAAVGFALDSRERRSFLEQLTSPDVGFHISEGGAWLWRFCLEPLHDEIDAPTGTAVQLTGLLGIPFARLRLALPDEVRAIAIICVQHVAGASRESSLDCCLSNIVRWF